MNVSLFAKKTFKKWKKMIENITLLDIINRWRPENTEALAVFVKTSALKCLGEYVREVRSRRNAVEIFGDQCACGSQ